MKLNRLKIQQMIDTGALNVGGRRTSSGGGGGGGGVSASWVDENYISKAFFARLFTIHSTTVTQDDPHGEVVEPNDEETDISNIEAMVGLWTEEYLSALGQGSGGGGGGGTILTEPLASINEAGLGMPSGSNKVIVFDGTQWTYKAYASGNGTVTSISPGTGLASSTGGAITTSGTLSISSDYQTKISHGDTAYGWGNHANAGYLTASSSVITTLQSYFDTNGNAKSALKLTTVSKTAWGQTYWTVNGVPDSISGNMTNVGNISFSDTGKNIGSVAYFDTTNHRLGIGSAPGVYKLDVNGDIRTSGNLYIGGTNRILSGGGDSAKNLLEFDGTQVTLAYGFRASNETRIYGQNISMYHGSTLKVQVTSTGLKIGDATLSWDSTNHALKIDTGFYSESFISALGAGSGGGSGSGITMADVWSALATPAPSSSQQQVEASHLTQALSGYASKSWVEGKNYVTLDTTQDISGAKSFTSDIRCYKSNASIYVCQKSGTSDIKKVGLNSDTNRGVWDFSYGAWLIGNNGTNTFLNVGNVGIGTTSPSTKLHVDGVGYFTSGINVGGLDQYHAFYVNGNTRLGGLVGIGTSAQSGYSLYVNGYIFGSRLYFLNGSYLYDAVGQNNLKFFYIEASYAYVNGNMIQTSDMRKKDIVSDLNISLESIANAPIFKFKWNDKRDYVTHVGTSAQYWDSVLPDCVIRTPDGTLGLDENAISLASVILTTRKVVDHERRIRLLEVKNEALRKEIEQLKAA